MIRKQLDRASGRFLEVESPARVAHALTLAPEIRLQKTLLSHRHRTRQPQHYH
jgi:hypothetical protein